jgi:hypothetical protein
LRFVAFLPLLVFVVGSGDGVLAATLFFLLVGFAAAAEDCGSIFLAVFFGAAAGSLVFLVGVAEAVGFLGAVEAGVSVSASAAAGSFLGGSGFTFSVAVAFFLGFGLLVVEVALAADRIGFFLPAGVAAKFSATAAASASASCLAVSRSSALR